MPTGLGENGGLREHMACELKLDAQLRQRTQTGQHPYLGVPSCRVYRHVNQGRQARVHVWGVLDDKLSAKRPW